MKPMTRLLSLLGLAAAVLTAPVHAQTSFERALRNYELLMRGQKRLEDLSHAEREEVIALERLAKAMPRDQRSQAERCRAEEIERVGGSPSELTLRIIGLKCSQR